MLWVAGGWVVGEIEVEEEEFSLLLMTESICSRPLFPWWTCGLGGGWVGGWVGEW